MVQFLAYTNPKMMREYVNIEDISGIFIDLQTIVERQSRIQLRGDGEKYRLALGSPSDILDGNIVTIGNI